MQLLFMLTIIFLQVQLLISIAVESSALLNLQPCFTAPNSSNCTALICSRTGTSTVACQDFANGVRAKIQKLVDADLLRTSPDNFISPYAMGVACFAKGNSIPGEHDCASCLHCMQQLSANVCSLFCPDPPPALSPAPSIPPNTQLHTVGGGARDATEPTPGPTAEPDSKQQSRFSFPWWVYLIAGCLLIGSIIALAITVLVIVLLYIRCGKKSNSGAATRTLS